MILRVRDIDVEVPAYGTPLDADDLMDIANRAGSQFFAPKTMRFFKSRLLDVVTGSDGWYFLTSEKDITGPRLYKVRRLFYEDNTVRIRPAVDGAFPTIERARTALKHAVRTAELVSR